MKLFIVLLIVGTLLGAGNIAVTFAIGAWLNPISFYEKLGPLKTFFLFQSVLSVLLIIPSLLSTAVMLLIRRKRLFQAKTAKDYALWGITFGFGVTILSTFFFLLEAVIYRNVLSTEGTNLVAELIAIPIGAAFLGVLLALAFSPAIVTSGYLYGLLAKKLKEKYSM